MRIGSVNDIAATVRGRRLELGVSQAKLARAAGVSRKWLGEFEAGKPSAELGLVLRLLDHLGITLEAAVPDARGDSPMPASPDPVDLAPCSRSTATVDDALAVLICDAVRLRGTPRLPAPRPCPYRCRSRCPRTWTAP